MVTQFGYQTLKQPQKMREIMPVEVTAGSQ
jgi:hypothetical protein